MRFTRSSQACGFGYERIQIVALRAMLFTRQNHDVYQALDLEGNSI